MLRKSVRQLLDEANAAVKTYTIDEAANLLNDPRVVFVDIREINELYTHGKIEGSVHVPRSMLEFQVDPAANWHNELFGEDKEFVFYCSGGMRSLLAAKVCHDMGLEQIANLEGGFDRWKDAGYPSSNFSPYDTME